MKELEDFLRENKPAVQDDPTFLLETRKRMDAGAGIVDGYRQLIHINKLADGFADVVTLSEFCVFQFHFASLTTMLQPVIAAFLQNFIASSSVP